MVFHAQVFQVFHKKLIAKSKNKLVTIVIPTNFEQNVVCGDYVEYVDSEKILLLTKVKHRKNFLIRPKAANIDAILIIYPINKIKSFKNLFWWILTYEAYNFHVKIIFSKSDLQDKKNLKKIISIQNLLKQLDVEYYDYHNQIQCENLLKKIKNHLVILSGNSGVGKSTFLNFLNPKFNITTNSLGLKNYGKHTTTTNKIYEINQIKFIDAPGFGGLNFNLDNFNISHGWNKFQKLKTFCKFNDCMHINKNQPCGVIDALDKNKISEELYEIYLSFINLKNKLK